MTVANTYSTNPTHSTPNRYRRGSASEYRRYVAAGEEIPIMHCLVAQDAGEADSVQAFSEFANVAALGVATGGFMGIALAVKNTTKAIAEKHLIMLAGNGAEVEFDVAVDATGWNVGEFLAPTGTPPENMTVVKTATRTDAIAEVVEERDGATATRVLGRLINVNSNPS